MTGDITSVEISPSGAEPYGACADIIIEGFTTGKTIDFGSGRGNPLDFDDIPTATIVFTVVSEGYDATGTLGTVTRTVYATEIVRQPYPNEASDEEPASTSIRVALSDFVYDDDNTGAGKSGTAPTVTITAGAIRNDGGSSETSAAATDLTCTNSSGLDYPEVIARWDRIAGVYTADRVTADFNMAVRAYHRSGIACVVFDADGQTSSNNETATATTRTATQRVGSGLYAEAYHSGDISLTSFTDDELIDIRFRAYPVVGDADSVRDSDNHTTSTEECLGYNKGTIVCDKDDDSAVYASVDATSGDDTTGVSSTTLATAEASPYQHIGDAIEDGATVIYLEDGTHSAVGHGFSRRTTSEWVIVTHHPTNSSKSGAIVQVDSDRDYNCERLQYKDVTFGRNGSSSWLDGEHAGNFLRLVGVDFDDDTSGSPSVGIGYRSDATYLDNCTGDMAEQEWNWESFSTSTVNYCFDGCDFGTPSTDGKNGLNTYELVACKSSGATIRVGGKNNAGPVKDHIEVSFNEILDFNSASAQILSELCQFAGDDITMGIAVVGNVFEKTLSTSPLAAIAGDSSEATANHVVLWHNTFSGERLNAGYNDSGSTAYARSNWSEKFNSYQEHNYKGDTFGTPSTARTGGWSIDYGVGALENNRENTNFDRRYPGFGDTTGSAGYVYDKSYTGDGSGNGDYAPDTGSTLLGRIPTGGRVVTVDLYGSRVYDMGDIGAVQVTQSDTEAGDTGWQPFTAAASVTPGNVNWSNPADALDNDSDYASADIPDGDTSYTLKLTGADLSAIPSDATLDGVEIRMEYTGENGGSEELIDHTIQLIVAGTQTGDNKARLTQWVDSSVQSVDFGGASDLWSTTPTVAQIKNSGTGVAIRVDSPGGSTAQARIYRVWIRVHWTPAGGGGADVTGTVAAGLSVSGAAIGARGVAGSASGGLSLSGGATGIRGIVGAVLSAFGLDASASGSRGSVGTALGGLSVSGEATGRRGVGGAVVAALGLTGAASGARGIVGAVLSALGLTARGTNSEGVTGTVEAGLSVTARASGGIGAPGPCDGTSMAVYLTGAADEGGRQDDPRESTGGYRSATVARSMSWDWSDPMPGVVILEVSGANGVGAGALGAPTDGSLTWTAPGSGAAGAAVALATGAEVIIPGADTAQWVRVRRVGTAPLGGTKALSCLDVYNDVIGLGDVASADAVAGVVERGAVILKNNAAGWLADFRVWVGDSDGNIAVAVELAVDGAIQTDPPSGLTWSTGASSAAGVAFGNVAEGASVGIRFRRTMAADSAASGSQLTEIKYSYSDGDTVYVGVLRGRYRVARADYVGYGVWVGDGVAPDLTADPDETFTSLPHTTGLSLADDATYHVVVRQRNQWGLWSQNIRPSVFEVDGDGDVLTARPTAPTDITVGQTADNEARVGALYDAGADGANAAHVFVIWVAGDGSTPDGSGSPSGYVMVDNRAALVDLVYSDTGDTWGDGTPLEVLLRTRRFVPTSGDAFFPDVVQLAASGTGSLKVSSVLSGWGSSGYGMVRRVGGAVLEVFSYSAVTIADGATTITVDGRALQGTAGTETSQALEVVPTTWVDSDNTTVGEWTIVATSPGRPVGDGLLGDLAAVFQARPSGPDGVTEEVIDAGENFYLLLGEGWTSLYMDTVLVWRVLWDSRSTERNGFYVPSEWTIVEAAVSGASGGSGAWDAAASDELYLVAGGVRRVKIDSTAMTITALSVGDGEAMPEKVTEAGALAQFAGALLLSWDPGVAEYATVGVLEGDGALRLGPVLDNTVDAAGVAAL